MVGASGHASPATFRTAVQIFSKTVQQAHEGEIALSLLQSGEQNPPGCWQKVTFHGIGSSMEHPDLEWQIIRNAAAHW